MNSDEQQLLMSVLTRHHCSPAADALNDDIQFVDHQITHASVRVYYKLTYLLHTRECLACLSGARVDNPDQVAVC